VFSDIGPDDPRLSTELLPVLLQLRPHLTADSLRAIYAEGHPQGLRYTAVYADGACVAVAGWRIGANTYAGRKLYVEDLVTDEAHRGGGAGRALLDQLAVRARAAGCTVLDLDSGVHRAAAHRFYMREGMRISAFHFLRTLD
jgi:GNAT superfamily N-acetyltransferase